MTAQRSVAVFGSSRTTPGSVEWIEAESVGSRLAQAGVSLITGGYGGTMEATSKGAAESGGHVIGVTAPVLFPERAGANEHVAELIEADSLLGRIGAMIDRADGVIAMPGSIGTATELLIAWNHNYLARQNGQSLLPTVAVGDGWRDVMATLIERIAADPGDIHVVDTAEDALAWLFDNM